MAAPTAELAVAHAVRRASHDLVEPLLDWEPGQDERLAGIRARVGALRQRFLDDGQATEVGVFVRDLKTGASFGFDADARFTSASLGKTIVLVALLVQEEMEPGFLQRRVFYPLWMSDNDNQLIAPKSSVRPGHEWSVGQLAEAMIAESDNNATSLISSALDEVVYRRVLADLGLRTMWEVDENGEASLTPRNYALVFRVLYNATYLGEGSSAQALALLARVTVTGGLRAGVPPGTVIAHKFGEWGRPRPGGFEQQFHDCGIVYAPGRPYLACVMTRGRSLPTLADAVTEVSRALWEGFAALPPP
ncbi:MAG: serine hydrolase [bacterium]|nr:serine hydrolase [Myxococcales bacterium]MCB9553150.1 serine hydrolase [Myxococcales bacterium]